MIQNIREAKLTVPFQARTASFPTRPVDVDIIAVIGGKATVVPVIEDAIVDPIHLPALRVQVPVPVRGVEVVLRLQGLLVPAPRLRVLLPQNDALTILKSIVPKGLPRAPISGLKTP